MQIAVCDDNAIDRQLIIGLLQDYFAEHALHYEITQYEDGIDLISDIQDGSWYDVIFLDIYMKHLLGIDVARRLRSLQYSGSIIFLTASPDFALDGYDVQAMSYELKPHSYEKLCLLMQRLDVGSRTYAIQRRACMVQVPLDEILYVESSNTKCLLHRTDGQTYTVYKKLDQIQQELGESRFLRCHQSYLVNMDHVETADKQFVLTNGDMVNIRQRDLRAIRQAYLHYAESKVK